jgi:DNA repair exonuclease SbcCD nuclease subunit
MAVRKILHAADVHLDSPMQNLESYPDAPVEAFRGATRRALSNLVDLALDQRVDLVVIAGDLYDGAWDDAHTGLYFVAEASRLRAAGIPIVVIRGNHDAALLMSDKIRLPDNPDGSAIMLDHAAVDRRVLASIGVAVHGRSFATRAVTDDLSRDYPAAIPGFFNLGLLHTCLTGSEGHLNYAPTSPEKLLSKGYDYWALGHIHDRRNCQPSGGTPIVFSGNIQGRHVRETGAKGCLILEVDDSNRVATTFHPLDVVRWTVMHHDASEDRNTDAMLEAFTPWLTSELDQSGHRPLAVRVRVSGASDQHDAYHRSVAGLEDQLRSISLQHGGGRVWIEQLRVRTTKRKVSGRVDGGRDPQIPLIAADADGPYASLHHVLDRFRNDPSTSQTIPDLLKPLWDKLPGGLVADPDDPFRPDSPPRIADWIDQAEPELVERIQTMEDAS